MIRKALQARRRGSQSGYTLVEIIVALLVVGIGFSALLACFPVALKWAGETAAYNTAALAAESLIAEHYGQTYSPDWLTGTCGYSCRVQHNGGTGGNTCTVTVYCYMKSTDRAASANTVAVFQRQCLH